MSIEYEIRWVLECFPNCKRGDFEIIDPATRHYNCYAYTFGITDRWLSEYSGIRDTELMLDMAAEHGFKQQPDMDTTVRPGQERIAFYVDGEYIRHGAKQRPDGRWESKLGAGPLIIHENLECLSCDIYGEPAMIFVREAA